MICNFLWQRLAELSRLLYKGFQRNLLPQASLVVLWEFWKSAGDPSIIHECICNNNNNRNNNKVTMKNSNSAGKVHVLQRIFLEGRCTPNYPSSSCEKILTHVDTKNNFCQTVIQLMAKYITTCTTNFSLDGLRMGMRVRVIVHKWMHTGSKSNTWHHNVAWIFYYSWW